MDSDLHAESPQVSGELQLSVLDPDKRRLTPANGPNLPQVGGPQLHGLELAEQQLTSIRERLGPRLQKTPVRWHALTRQPLPGSDSIQPV